MPNCLKGLRGNTILALEVQLNFEIHELIEKFNE